MDPIHRVGSLSLDEGVHRDDETPSVSLTTTATQGTPADGFERAPLL